MQKSLAYGHDSYFRSWDHHFTVRICVSSSYSFGFGALLNRGRAPLSKSSYRDFFKVWFVGSGRTTCMQSCRLPFTVMRHRADVITNCLKVCNQQTEGFAEGYMNWCDFRPAVVTPGSSHPHSLILHKKRHSKSPYCSSLLKQKMERDTWEI